MAAVATAAVAEGAIVYVEEPESPLQEEQEYVGSPAAQSDELNADFMDEAFRKFFRLAENDNEFDKLSLLACNRQGIRADELLYRPVEAFMDYMTTADKASLRYTVFEKRRQAKLKVVEDERHLLLVQLFNKSATLSPQKQRELISRTEQRLALSALGGDKKEEEQGMSAMQAIKSAAKAKGIDSDYAKKGKVDYEKLRQRELKLVEKELTVEVKREELYTKMQQKEQRAQEIAEQRRQIRMERISEQREIATLRIQRLRDTQEIADLEKRKKLAELDLKRQQREQRKIEEREKLQLEKAQLLVNKMHTVQERNKLVQQTLQNRCEMQLKDMANKHQLFFERRKNIELHRDTLKEINKIRSLQKAIAISDATEKRDSEEEMWKMQLLEKHRQGDDRLKSQIEVSQNIQRERQLLLQAKEEKRKELKDLHDLRHQEQLNAVLVRHHQKEVYLEERKHRKSQEQELKNEAKMLRMQNWIDNRQRINRVEEYKELVKQAKIKADAERTEELARQKKQQSEERQRHKKALRMEKEKLLAEVEHIRHSPNPAVYLEKSTGGAKPENVSRVNSPASYDSGRGDTPLGPRGSLPSYNGGATPMSGSESPASASVALTDSRQNTPFELAQDEFGRQGSSRGTKDSREKGPRSIVRDNLRAQFPDSMVEVQAPGDLKASAGGGVQDQSQVVMGMSNGSHVDLWSPPKAQTGRQTRNDYVGGPAYEPDAYDIYLKKQPRTTAKGRNFAKAKALMGYQGKATTPKPLSPSSRQVNAQSFPALD